jgi:lipopolysaccharide/colanic/teichoic acid biosynthesis glycosyltransferase
MPIEVQCYEKRIVRRDNAQAIAKGALRSSKPLAGNPISDLEFQIPDVPSNRYMAFKSLWEFVFATCLLILTSPLILLIVTLVRLTSRGPGIYSQVRLGRLGRPYRIYKIRTMAHECEKRSGACWSTGHDPRVTRLGRFLRRTHLDELPQLWNVIRGDMSLIGPRPERPEFIPTLQQSIPHYTDRLLVRPGVTGLAQVQQPADTDLESVRRKLAYDLYYVRHISFWMDLRIMGCTLFKVAGVPYHVLRGLFLMPSRYRVERAYRKLGGALEAGNGIVSRMQLA